MSHHSIAMALSTTIVALGLITTSSSAAPLAGLKGAAAGQSIVSAVHFGHHGFGHHGFGGHHGFFGHHHHHLHFGFVPYYYSAPYSCYPYCWYGGHRHHHHWWGHHHHGHGHHHY